MIKHIWIQIVLLLSMFASGAVIFAVFQKLDSLSALLASVSTITTIGIYAPNIVLMANTEKILLIIVFLVSVGSAASLVQGTVSQAMSKQILSEELSEKKIKRLKGHVIVAGYKFIGKYVTHKLDEIGQEYVVTTIDESKVKPLREKGVNVIYGAAVNAFETLQKAGIERASSIVVTYDSDGENMLTLMAARKLNPKIRTITIINDKDLYESAKDAQADVVIAPNDMAGQILALSTISDEITGVLLSDRMHGRHIAEFAVAKGGYKIKELNMICPVLMVLRDGEVVSTFAEDFVLKAGDFMFTLTDHEKITQFRQRLNELDGKLERGLV